MSRPTIAQTIGLLLTLCGIGFLLSRSNPVIAQGSAPQAPIFEVDPFWPKPLPNHWVTGSTIGLSVDAQDRVWTIHRPNTGLGKSRYGIQATGTRCRADG